MVYRYAVTLLLLCSNILGLKLSSPSEFKEYAHSSKDVEDIETTPTDTVSRGFGSRDRYEGDQNLCPGKSFCTLLSRCRLLVDLMDRSCLIPARLKDVTCGYQRNELMVCCPQGGYNSMFKPSDHEDEDISEPDSDQRLNVACGKPQLNGWQSGWNGLGSHPWVVRVGFKNSESGLVEYPCCGSLITSKVVLTAAHCALAKYTSRTLESVRVGEYDMKTDPDCTNSFCAHPVQNVPVASIVVHPSYDKKTFRDDVALIILKTAVNYSLGAQPMCLLQNSNQRLVGESGTLVGFGKLPGDDVVSPKQHQLRLPIVPLEECYKLYNDIIPIRSSHLCVGGEAKKDACSGFGGAPLVLLDPTRRDRFYQVGMVSFGSDRCGTPRVPSVYTSIREYVPWITQNLP